MVARLVFAGCLAVALAGRSAADVGLAQLNSADARRESANLYRLVRLFDFDEQKLGNYELTPMYWYPLTGPGLPAYNSARLDFAHGSEAPPSFGLRLDAFANVGVEYRHGDLAAAPGSDYVIVGHVRAERLVHARALMVAYFVDRFEQEIPGSRRVSNLVAATHKHPEPWQEVRIDLPGDSPDAYALRLQLWVLQSYVWREVDPRIPDPIPQHDVLAAAWFDDIAIFRLPRMRVRFSNEAHLVVGGQQEAVIVDMNNSTPYPLGGDVRIVDPDGVVRQSTSVEIEAETGRTSVRHDADAHAAHMERRMDGAATVRIPIDPLPPGEYEARFRLHFDERGLMERRLRFVCLAPLPDWPRMCQDLGADLGVWPGGDGTGLPTLLRELGISAVRFALPAPDELERSARPAYLDQLAGFCRTMNELRIETVAALLGPRMPGASGRRSLRWWISSSEPWALALRPALAALGAHISVWQLGDDRLEQVTERWSASERQRLDAYLGQFMSSPRLAMPHDVFTPVPHDQRNVISVRLDPRVPTRSLGWQLGELAAAAAEEELWLSVDLQQRADLSARTELVDFARRFVIAKLADPRRLFSDVLAMPGADGRWTPDERYIYLRTLMWALHSQRFVGVLHPAEHVVGILLERGETQTLILWTWEDQPAPTALRMVLGGATQALDLRGTRFNLPRDGQWTLVRPTPEPLIIEGVDAALAQLAERLDVRPLLVQPSRSTDIPTLTFQNFYGTELTGELSFSTSARDWRVEPAKLDVTLPPGGELRQELLVRLPQRQVAAFERLQVSLTLRKPRPARVDFEFPLSVGLSEIEVLASHTWEGQDLLVEQRLSNRSERAVSFLAFCEAPQRPREDGAFLEVAPGETRVQLYRLPDARELTGATLYLGIKEIRGKRRLDQLLPIE